jgi:hypothetical protein
MQTRRNDLLLSAILWWTAVLAGVLVWLPLVRGATQGEAYQWELAAGIGGRGIGGDYWLLVTAAAFVWMLLSLGWRGARAPFHWLLLLFHLPIAAAVCYRAWVHPEDFRFEGATIGVNFSLTYIGPILFAGFALVAVFWVSRDLIERRFHERVPWVWTRSTRIRLILVVILVPVEVVLFHSGGIRSAQNVFGVGLVFWQWFTINRVIATARMPEISHPAI